MAHRSVRRPVTEQEYLLFEEASDVRHELVAGEVYAMSGATPRHNAIALNIATRLRELGRARGCRTFVSDVKLRLPDGTHYYYPDVMLVCDPAGVDEHVVHAPCLVVEVTSPSTEATDRREKGPNYRTIPSLGAYLIVDQEQRHITRHWRDATGQWWTEELLGNVEVPLPCPFGAHLTLDEIYEDT